MPAGKAFGEVRAAAAPTRPPSRIPGVAIAAPFSTSRRVMPE